MLRWLGPKRVQEETGRTESPPDGEVTDDPLAAIDFTGREKIIYAVSRINPLYDYTETKTAIQQPPLNPRKTSLQPGEKSTSSGYGGSSNDPLDFLKDDPKRITTKKPPSDSSGSGGTLNTIPEGKIEDFTIPRPIWPYCNSKLKRQEKSYDSLVDDTLLLYTSLSFRPDSLDEREAKQISVREVLLELLHGINATIEGKTGLTPEEMLRLVNEKLSQSVEVLKENSEKDVKNFCTNLSNCKTKNSVVRAFSNNSSSSSGNSSQGSSPEWNGRRSSSVETNAYDIYHSPSGSSSSGFSDTQEFSGVRNAMIYGTLCRTKLMAVKERSAIVSSSSTKKNSLLTMNDGKPSVWEQYYGMDPSSAVVAGGGGVGGGEVKYVVKPTDVPLFPGGRPEADFTLDVPRSELLSKKMKQDKKWRCRCRVLTSFFGLVFFLLSVMAVSLMLTRGKRMFGSMV